MKYEITWLNDDKDEPVTRIDISNEQVSIPNCCHPYYRIIEKDIRYRSKCIPELKILASYHNPKGYDFIIYENGMISDIGWGNKVGILKIV